MDRVGIVNKQIETNEQAVLLKRLRLWLMLFVIGLVLSGLTAFPLRFEVDLLARWLGAANHSSPNDYNGLLSWIVHVRNALRATDASFPFLAYGTDWLAFAHLIIAVAFLGAWRDPARNIWIFSWAMIACVGIIPLALICGAIRGIPLGWRLIDCSFGVVGIIPLLMCRNWARRLCALDSRFALVRS